MVAAPVVSSLEQQEVYVHVVIILRHRLDDTDNVAAKTRSEGAVVQLQGRTRHLSQHMVVTCMVT